MLSVQKEKISIADLRELTDRSLRALGVPGGASADCAQVLVLADMMGIHTHGAARVVSYGERLRIGGIKADAALRVERLAPGMARVEGDNGLGPVVGARALAEAMACARETGIAAVFCAGSNHFGPIAPYAWMAAQEGFASLIASNATTTIAPTGGAAARLGNNPMGFGFPNPGGDPVILDMAISVAARAKIRNAAKAGEEIPEGWATDAQGLPTTDPNAALKGFLLPMGGYKGYGLSICVDLLTGLLAGASYLTHVKSWVDEPEAPQNLGHTFILIDTSKLAPAETLHERMEDFTTILRDTPRSAPDVPVMLPGERELTRMKDAQSDGISLDADLLAELRSLAG